MANLDELIKNRDACNQSMDDINRRRDFVSKRRDALDLRIKSMDAEEMEDAKIKCNPLYGENKRLIEENYQLRVKLEKVCDCYNLFSEALK